jgi:hypothetical protein
VIRPTASLPQVVQSISAGLTAAGRHDEAAKLAGLVSPPKAPGQESPGSRETMRSRTAARDLLKSLHGSGKDAELISHLRTLDPFALEGESHRPGPILLIEDTQLLNGPAETPLRVNPAAWKNGAYTGGPRSPQDVYLGGAPMVIYTSDLGGEAEHRLPAACIFDSQDYPDRPPYIWWNSLKDLPDSKLMHISNQAFYLRRYARRVATRWETDYGHRPILRARTAVSLNGRPYQFLVDPAADLASVPVTWFGHNTWIRDMEMPRIPREALRERIANRSN